MNRNKEIAQEIVRQLGNKALWLIGAKNLTAIDNGLRFKFSHREYNYISIILTPMDEYRMLFEKWHNGKRIREKVVDNLFFDQLHETIEQITGLTTTIPNMVSKNF